MTRKSKVEEFDPTDERPWNTAEDGRAHDAGAPWCLQAECHPGRHGGSPHPEHGYTECQTWGGHFRGGAVGPDGDHRYVQVYAARPFTVGQERRDDSGYLERLIFEFADGNDEPGEETRFSLRSPKSANSPGT